MGGAQLSIADDVYAPFWNPAGLKNKRQIGSTFATLQGEVNYTYLGYVHPFDFGPVGFSYLSTGINGFISTSLDGVGHPVSNGSEFGFGNTALLVTYAENMQKFVQRVSLISGFYQPWMAEVSLGGTFKYLSQTLDTGSSSGFGVDVGFQYKMDPKLSLSGVVYNFLPPNLVWNTGAIDALPIKVKAGAGYQYSRDLLFVADVDLIGYKEGGIYLGTQYQVVPQCLLRAGYNKNVLTFGVGVIYQQFNCDFAYEQASTSYQEASTRLSIGYSFESGSTQQKAVSPVQPKIEQVTYETPAPILEKEDSEESQQLIREITPLMLDEIVEDSIEHEQTKPQILPDLADEVITVKKARYGITGTVLNTKTLLINGQKTPFSSSGSFAKDIILKPGLNVIVIKAYSQSKEFVKVTREIKLIK